MTPYHPDRSLRSIGSDTARRRAPANRPYWADPAPEVHPVWDSPRVEHSLQEALFRNGHKNPLSKAAQIVDLVDRHDRATRLARLYATDTDNPMSSQQLAGLILAVLTGEVKSP